MKRKRSSRQALTAVELEMMNIIWRVGPCSISQVLEELPDDRALAYTSVSTIVRILEQKGFVTSEKTGRGHVYAASVGKDDYQASSLHHLVRDVFDGTPALVVRRLLDSDSLSAGDLKQIRALLKGKSER